MFIHTLLLLSVVVAITCNDTFKYFGYGSNLLKNRVKIQNPSASFIGIAKLENYRLDFNKYSDLWDGAAATIVEDPGQTVWGDVWDIDLSQVDNLDKQELVDEAWYYAKNVTVTTPEGKNIVARTYILISNPPKVRTLPPERQPSNTYMNVIILGAIESKLPYEYIKHLFTYQTNGKQAPVEFRQKLGYPFYVED